MILKSTISVSLALSLFCAPLSGNAQSDTTDLNSLSLRELLNVKITTASKTVQNAELASAVVKVITKEEIRSRGYQSLLDALYDLPDIKIDDKMYSSTRNSITMRGIQGSEKILILLDGVNISGPSGEAMPIMQNYPVYFAEQIEILYGPASALYGANAVAGIINIITKKNNAKQLVMEASSSAGSYGYTNSTLYLSKKIAEKTFLTLSGQYFYDKGPDFSRLYDGDSLFSRRGLETGVFNSLYGTFQPATPFKSKYEAPMEAYNIYGALNTAGFTFTLFHTYFRVPNGFENNLNNAIYNSDVNLGQSITTGNAAYKKDFGKITSTTMMTASKYSMSPKSNYRNLYTSMEPGYKYATSSMVRGEQQLDYRASDKLNMTGGISYEQYHAIPQSGDLERPVDPQHDINGIYLGTRSLLRPEGIAAQFYFLTYSNTGAYYQVNFNAAKRFNLTAGARYDYNSRYGSTFNPRAGVVVTPGENTTIKVLYGQAFRAPSPSDSYSHWGAFDSHDSGRTYHSHFLHLPNPRLKPIRSYNSEINISQRISDELIITVDGYYTVLKGLFSHADDNATTKIYNNSFIGLPVDYIEVFVNKQNQKNYGGSVELKWKHRIGTLQMRTTASVSYAEGFLEKGIDDYGTEIKEAEIDFISPWMARIGTDIKAGKFTCSPRLNLLSRQRLPGFENTDGNRTTRQTIAGYALLNLSARYQLTRQFAVYTNVSNALDQRYTAVGFNMDLKKEQTELYRGQPQDPIRFMGGLQFSL